MVVGESGDLRQVRDAHDLVHPRQRPELLAHRFGGTPTDAGIDLIEHQGSLPRSAATRTALHARLERQHYPREFAAGGDLLRRAQRLAGIGRD